MFNLISEAWIPVVRRDGKREAIPPWGITDGMDVNPVVAMDWPRPDFEAGVAEFLVGLLQTTLEPADDKAWERLLTAPPQPESLRVAFAKEADAFELFNEDGPAFQQDFTPGDLHKDWDIRDLLISAAGSEMFVRSGAVRALCPSCAAAALQVLQQFAPSGGRGHRVSLRGGGPVSGLVLGDTLWATLWSNVVLRKDYDKGTDAQAPRAGGIFPWLAPTRTSSNDEAILAGNVHPLHVFWSMPRRIRLTAPDTEGQCDVCGISGPVVTSFRAVHHGGKYSGEWRHPLTPMRIDQNAGPLSIKGTALMGCYRDWWGLLFAEREKVGDEMVTRRHPSPAVLRHLERLHSEYRDVHEIRLRFCGYAMDNMKPLAWAEETMPARVAATSEDRKQQAEEVERLVRCADHVRSCLYSAVGGALADEKQKSPNGSTLLEAVNVRFWSATQPAFLDAVDRCLARLDDEDARKAARRVFLETLQNRAAAIFNESVLAVSPDDTQFERIGAAWGKLRGYTHGDKSRVWDILGILPPRRPERPEPPESPEFAEQAAPQEQGANR